MKKLYIIKTSRHSNAEAKLTLADPDRSQRISTEHKKTRTLSFTKHAMHEPIENKIKCNYINVT